MLLSCLGASSSFEDQWTSLNGPIPVDVGQASGPQQTGRGYGLHRQSLFVVVVVVLDNRLILCLNQRSLKLILGFLSLYLPEWGKPPSQAFDLICRPGLFHLPNVQTTSRWWQVFILSTSLNQACEAWRERTTAMGSRPGSAAVLSPACYHTLARSG